MEKGFNKQSFLEYLEGSCSYGLDFYLRQIINNIIDYATENEHISKDMFCHWVSNMLSIDFGEVAMFMEDDCLTEWGIEQKNKYMKGVE